MRPREAAHSRVLFDLFMYKRNGEDEKLDREGAGPGKGGDEPVLLADVNAGIADEVVDCLKKYREAIPLEYNLAGLNAISFDKECYVGQELVVRTHHRGVIRKRLMPLNFVRANGEEAQQSLTPGAEVVNEITGKKVGKVTTVLGPRGLGLVRLDSAKALLIIEKPDDVYVQAV